MEEPLKRDFYFGCPRCLEPITTLKHGNHIDINVTVRSFGSKAGVSLHCTICGSVKDISKNINLVSQHHFEEILKKGKKEVLSLKETEEVLNEYSTPYELERTERQKKIDMAFYLMCRCDLGNGRISNVTKDQIDDIWVGDDLEDIIQSGQYTCAKMRGGTKCRKKVK